MRNLKSKKWSDSDKFAKDRQILGVTALAWNMFKSHAPKEIIDMLQEDISEAGMPPMSAEGQGGIFLS